MIKLFSKRAKKQNKTTVDNDPVICRIKVYNRAINAPVATVDFKLSEKYLIGAFKAQYPASTYRVEIISF